MSNLKSWQVCVAHHDSIRVEATTQDEAEEIAVKRLGITHDVGDVNAYCLGAASPIPAPVSEPSADEGSHPEDFCERCHCLNVKPWFAPSPLWNAVMRSTTGDDLFNIVCPVCFAELAEQRGITGAWYFTMPSADLQSLWKDGDGRVWDESVRLWVAASSPSGAPSATEMSESDVIITLARNWYASSARTRGDCYREFVERVRQLESQLSAALRERDEWERKSKNNGLAGMIALQRNEELTARLSATEKVVEVAKRVCASPLNNDTQTLRSLHAAVASLSQDTSPRSPDKKDSEG